MISAAWQRPAACDVPELFVVEPFPAVHHLVSTITAQLPPTATPAPCCVPASRRVDYRCAESTRDGNHRRTRAAATKCLLWQHCLPQLSAAPWTAISLSAPCLPSRRTITAGQAAASLPTAMNRPNIRKRLIKLHRILPQLGEYSRDVAGTTADLAHYSPRRGILSALSVAATDASPHSICAERRQAAVLIPIICRAEPTILLTRRSDILRKHAGQVAFPGGAADATDASLIATALREARKKSPFRPSRCTC